MRAILWSLLLALPAAGEPGRAYLTELGRRVLAKSDQIVSAKVVKLLPPFRGISTAHLEVSERLSGYDRERLLVLLYVEDSGRNQAKRTACSLLQPETGRASRCFSVAKIQERRGRGCPVDQ